MENTNRQPKRLIKSDRGREKAERHEVGNEFVDNI